MSAAIYKFPNVKRNPEYESASLTLDHEIVGLINFAEGLFNQGLWQEAQDICDVCTYLVRISTDIRDKRV